MSEEPRKIDELELQFRRSIQGLTDTENKKVAELQNIRDVLLEVLKELRVRK